MTLGNSICCKNNFKPLLSMKDIWYYYYGCLLGCSNVHHLWLKIFFLSNCMYSLLFFPIQEAEEEEISRSSVGDSTAKTVTTTTSTTASTTTKPRRSTKAPKRKRRKVVRKKKRKVTRKRKTTTRKKKATSTSKTAKTGAKKRKTVKRKTVRRKRKIKRKKKKVRDGIVAVGTKFCHWSTPLAAKVCRMSTIHALKLFSIIRVLHFIIQEI